MSVSSPLLSFYEQRKLMVTSAATITVNKFIEFKRRVCGEVQGTCSVRRRATGASVGGWHPDTMHGTLKAAGKCVIFVSFIVTLKKKDRCETALLLDEAGANNTVCSAVQCIFVQICGRSSRRCSGSTHEDQICV